MNIHSKNFGSAHDGTHHSMTMRYASLALLPLCLWFVLDAFPLLLLPLDEARAWFKHTWRVVLLVAFFACAFHHTLLELQVVCEDYISSNLKRFILIATLRYLSFFLFIALTITIITLHFAHQL